MKSPPACATYLAIKSFLILISDSHRHRLRRRSFLWFDHWDLLFSFFVDTSVVALRARVRPAQHVKYPWWFSDANWPNSIWCWSSHISDSGFARILKTASVPVSLVPHCGLPCPLQRAVSRHRTPKEPNCSWAKAEWDLAKGPLLRSQCI